MSRWNRELVPDFEFAPLELDEVGAASVDGDATALASAPLLDQLAVMPATELPPHDWGAIEFTADVLAPTATHVDPELIVHGLAGEGVTGAEGAVDRIAEAILASLEQRETLVIWAVRPESQPQQPA